MKKYLVFSLLLVIGVSHAFYISCASNSMYPALDCNSKYKLEWYKNNYKDVKVGDIIVFKVMPEDRFNNKWIKTSTIIHRVINITDQGYMTKGDNNPKPDPFITKPYLIVWKMTVK